MFCGPSRRHSHHHCCFLSTTVMVIKIIWQFSKKNSTELKKHKQTGSSWQCNQALFVVWIKVPKIEKIYPMVDCHYSRLHYIPAQILMTFRRPLYIAATSVIRSSIGRVTVVSMRNWASSPFFTFNFTMSDCSQNTLIKSRNSLRWLQYNEDLKLWHKKIKTTSQSEVLANHNPNQSSGARQPAAAPCN